MKPLNVWGAMWGVVLLASPVWAADYTGFWSGTGEVEMFTGKESQGKAPCRTFQYDIRHTPEEFTLESGYFFCGEGLEVTFEKKTYAILAGKLLDKDYNGNPIEVGTITDDGVIKFLFKQGGDTSAFDIAIKGDTADYSELWTDGYTSLVINGKLTRSQVRK